MGSKQKKIQSKLTRAQELQKKYPGHRPIPPSKRTVIITLAATVILSLLIVFVFMKKIPTIELPSNRYVELETSMGNIKLELYSEKAPRTVAQFCDNVNAGRYDGLTFHRVVEGFMIQGGDPNGNGTGGGSVAFEKTDISHIRGTISMASSQAGVTQSDMQFFIMDGDSTNLDGQFAAFGRVYEGMDVVDKIAGVAVGPNPAIPGEQSIPLTKITIIGAREIFN